MTGDYNALRRDNERRYGTDINRVGKLLLADRYGERTHFIYELLQNAEDALRRRTGWTGSRTVSFDLNEKRLRVSHFGVPFDEDDVRAVCGIGENDGKRNDLTAIGRFGIGFKSVYAFTDRPEIHSGAESFAIEKYVHPVRANRLHLERDETVISIPFGRRGGTSKTAIADQLGSHLDMMRALLFLREIRSLRWSVDGGASGLYERKSEELDLLVRRVRLIRREVRKPTFDIEWLVFQRRIDQDVRTPSSYVEIAFYWGKTGTEKFKRVKSSPLVAYFPTTRETHMGFLMQGPYRTTLTRDGVPFDNDWNRRCLQETGALLTHAVRWLCHRQLLNWEAIKCLPTDEERFQGSALCCLFRVTRDALRREALLPSLGGGRTSGVNACLAGSYRLQELLSADQLTALLGGEERLQWLDVGVSRAKTLKLYYYFKRSLRIREFTPDTLVAALRQNDHFLPGQTDEWIRDLYSFLGTQRSLHQRLVSLPIIRLDDGSHVSPRLNGKPQAFLPSSSAIDLPTVRPPLCQPPAARKFLRALGVGAPDLVDHVIRSILPRYGADAGRVSPQDYAADVEQILQAARVRSSARRKRLERALREACWVKAVDGVGSERTWRKPGEIYLAEERLVRLFKGVAGVFLLDSGVACLRETGVLRLLERLGASRRLRPVPVQCDLSSGQLVSILQRQGLEIATRENRIEDTTILGLDELVATLPKLTPRKRTRRAGQLWEELDILQAQCGKGPFMARFGLGVASEADRGEFESQLVRTLNQKPWVPDSSCDLQQPHAVEFDGLAWKPNKFLLSVINFGRSGRKKKRKRNGAGNREIESSVIDLLRERGLTTVEALRAALGPDADDDANGGEDGTATVMVGSHRVPGPDEADFDEVDPSTLEVLMSLEARAIEFILEQEPDWQRTEPGNPGFDLYKGDSIADATEWCEVKAIARTLNDRIPTMSSIQFDFAKERRGAFSLYVVERAGTDDLNLVRIPDPANAAKRIIFNSDERAAAWVGHESRPHLDRMPE